MPRVEKTEVERAQMTQYLAIAAHYARCFETHGDNHKGVNWPNLEDAERRYRVMLDVIRPDADAGNVRLLDVGCGAGHLLEFIRRKCLSGIDYVGLDISDVFIDHCRTKFDGVPFLQVDLLTDEPNLGPVEYAVMNGVFTEKLSLSHDEMFDFFKQLVKRVHGLVSRGLAFNVMSKQVDWERDDLFHLSLDQMAGIGADFLSAAHAA